MSTLVIAEKKEVGEAIANAFSKMLNIPIQKKNGVNYVGGFTITALAGHVMKLKEWEEIDPELKKWTLERYLFILIIGKKYQKKIMISK